jgi:hypothetical protein
MAGAMRMVTVMMRSVDTGTVPSTRDDGVRCESKTVAKPAAAPGRVSLDG